MTIQRHFKLALTAGHTIPLVINANQYDSGEQWLFTLYNDGVRYTPSSGAIVGIKADRLGIINTGTVDANGRVVINETRQMTAAIGKNIFELLIDDQTHGTANFMVLVEPRPGDNADLSESDYSLFEEAIQGTSQAAIKAGVQEWMDENLTDPTDPIVDASLSLSGAAADAKKTGDEILALKSAIEGSGSFSEYARQLLIAILRRALYDTDQKQNIDLLEYDLLNSGETTYYSVSYTGSGYSLDSQISTVPSGRPFSVGITANNNREIESVTVTMSGAVVPDAWSNGRVTISSVTGDVVISVVVGGVYTITNNLEGVTNSNILTEIGRGESYVATLTAENAPLDSVTVVMGGVTVIDTTVSDYSYAIDIASVTGNIIITANTEEISVDTVYTIPMADYKYLNASGELVDVSTDAGMRSWNGSERYVEIPNDADYVRFVCGSGMRGYSICYYDSSKEFISRTWSGYGQSVAYRIPDICPANAKYIRVGAFKVSGVDNSHSVDVTFCESLPIAEWVQNGSHANQLLGDTALGSVPSTAMYVISSVRTDSTSAYWRGVYLKDSTSTTVQNVNFNETDAKGLVTIDSTALGNVSFVRTITEAIGGTNTPEKDIVVGWA